MRYRDSIGRIVCIAMACLLLVGLPGRPAAAESGPVFRLPFVEAAGPNTWLLGQTYGNTTSAYRLRDTMYAAGQGIHFGIDFLSPCGTPVVAMADGIVFAADEPRFGSLPHNLLIDHPDLGYASFYGHLLETPNLEPGQIVKAGDVVGLTGDPAGTCYGRPHLHLEIRDLSHWRKFNPVSLIDADWDNLSLIGSFGTGFQRDLNDPRRWQQLDDQPETIAGGPMLNDYDSTWPPDWGSSEMGQAVRQEKDVFVPISPMDNSQPKPLSSDFSIQPPVIVTDPTGSETGPMQLTADGCCVQPSWRPDSKAMIYLDRDPRLNRTGMYVVPIDEMDENIPLFSSVIASYSPDYAYRALPTTDAVALDHISWHDDFDNGAEPTIIRRWLLPAGADHVQVSPDETTAVWQQIDPGTAIERWVAQVWAVDLESDTRRYLGSVSRGSVVGWISNESLLLSTRPGLESSDQTLCALSLTTFVCSEIVTAKGLRDPRISSGGEWIAYFTAFNESPQDNGIWIASADGNERRRLPPWMFGAYAWRDNTNLLVIPMRSTSAFQEFWQVNVEKRIVTPISGYDMAFKIANSDWSISPDGRHIAFVESSSRSISVMSLPN